MDEHGTEKNRDTILGSCLLEIHILNDVNVVKKSQKGASSSSISSEMHD